MTLVVVDAVGLTPRALQHMPRVSKLGADGFQARLDPIVPAVTCSVQATFVTGLTPTDHGIVGNGWYFRDLGEVFLWRQHNKLVQGEKVWETARRAKPGFRTANLCWWYAMGASTDLTVTPRPIYHADGRKSPDCYTYPPQLHDNLTGPLGEFPLFQYWGPTANIKSTAWIANAAKIVLDKDQLDMLLVYLPHLDYDHQRFGPGAPESVKAAQELDGVLGDLIDHARGRGDQVVVLSRVRHHRREAAGGDQPRAAPRGLSERLHAGGHGVPRPVDLARVRGLRPPDRARLRRRPVPISRARAR